MYQPAQRARSRRECALDGGSPGGSRAPAVGVHSAGLQRILNVFRGEPLAGKYVLVEVQPHVKWQLAQLSGRRGAPVPLLDQFFTDLAEAERAVFKLRWKEHTGQDLLVS